MSERSRTTRTTKRTGLGGRNGPRVRRQHRPCPADSRYVPNWTYNRLRVLGDPEELNRFVLAVEEQDADQPAALDFERHVPTPARLLARVSDNPRSPVRSPTRDDEWFAWRRRNWGTKWNAMWPTREGDSQAGRATYSFATAWAPPEPWLRTVSSLHPELVFELEFIEEFLQGSGGAHYIAGELVERWHVDPEASDWIELREEDDS